MVEPTKPLDASSALLQRLRELKRQERGVDADTSAARDRWLGQVETLMRAIRAWMLPAVQEGLVRVDSAAAHIEDDEVGAYHAPALKLTLPGERIIWVRPVGTLRVGAQGIVDVVCGSSRALLVLNRAGMWKVRGAGPSSTLVILDGHTFSRTLGELIA